MADRDELFGALALQAGDVTQAALIEASVAVSLSSGSLADELASSGALSAAKRTALEARVDALLREHGGDPARALASLGPVRAAAAPAPTPVPASAGFGDDDDEGTSVLDWDRATRKSADAVGAAPAAAAPRSLADDEDEESTSVLDWDRAARKSTETELKPGPSKK